MNVNAEYVVRGLDVVGTESFYTGKAGQDFVAHSIVKAFGYNTLPEARRRAAMLNKGTSLHGWLFIVVGRVNDEMRSYEMVDCLNA